MNRWLCENEPFATPNQEGVMTQLTHSFVSEIIRRGIEAGLERNFEVACAVVDADGRTRGVIRHDDALWVTPEFALGKARLASAFRNNTGAMFARLQDERPLYGATIAGLNGKNEWFLAEGGAAIKVVAADGRERCLGAVGVSGCFPAIIDQEIADELVAWIKQNIAAT
jgi:uncharacterized protein GlcG (DUF336 family)